MYALDKDLARRRIVYPRPLATLPDVMVIDIPEAFAGPGLPLGRYYPILIETERERVEVDRYLHARRPGPVVPDLLDHRPSQLEAARITIAAYEPPVPDWPYVQLCHWPAAWAAMAEDRSLFARGSYTTEMFATLEAQHIGSERLLAALSSSHPVEVSLIPSQTHLIGRA